VANPSVAALAVALRLGAGLDIDVAGGEIPTAGRGQGEVSATLTVVPRLGLRNDDGAHDLRLSYFPRFFYRYPASLALGRPTLLHQLAFGYVTPIAQTSHVGFDASAAYGESDFTATQAVFGEDQVIAPEDSLTEVARVEGQPHANTRLDPRTTLRLALPMGYQETSGRTSSLTRTTWDAGVNPGATHQLTRRDVLDFDVGATYMDADLAKFFQTRAFLGWGHTITRRWWSSLGGGVTRVDTLELDPLRTEGVAAAPTTASSDRRPASHFGLAQARVTHGRSSGTESASLGLDADLDPVLGQVRSRGTAALGATQLLSHTLSASESVTAGSSVAREPLVSDPNETILSVKASMAWRATRIMTLRWGTTVGWAGPHWRNGLEPRQRTVLGFVGLSLFYPPE
jgi:hypothetical protein